MLKLSSDTFELLRKDEEFVLFRSRGTGDLPAALIVTPVSEPPAPESLKRLEHEYALRSQLEPEWAARPIVLVRGPDRTMLLLEDGGGMPLDQLLGPPFEVGQFLRLARGAAAALGQLHRRGLIHKDLKPSHLLVDAPSGHAWLTGFGLASRVPRERPAAEPPEVIAGNLAYLAPEQTGRMNRSVDSRADLYALGVIFYQLLTGALPFTAGDPLEWVHCHIARPPVPPAERVAAIPEPLSALVLKLLAKTPEERYQSAAGLAADLRRCLAAWQAQGRIEPFALGEHDVPDRLVMPEKLFGRETERQALLAAFERVVASGRPELVLVAGYSGVGKSSLVHELQRALVGSRGLFLAGKFDQGQREIPYATALQAFQGLARQLLSQREQDIGPWREALRASLGPNGRLLVNLIPELEMLIGPQPPVPELPAPEAQQRFETVLRRFVGAVARPEHPLALFLDDLQWLDPASLQLLEALLTHPDELRHLLLIGAYRANEVGAGHPLKRTLEALRARGAPVQEVVLEPLSLENVTQWVAEALRAEPGRVRPLAALVHQKTGGNPFFARQFLSTLVEEGLLVFDPQAAWRWELDGIRAQDFSDNVVELMAGKLQRLPAATQEALQELACLGNRVGLSTLALVGGSEEAVHTRLSEAARAGLVFREERGYHFLHDRVQEAAYGLIPEALRPQLHLRLGRQLLARLSPEKLGERLYEVVNQFNRGAALITEAEEQAQAAELNLRAGRKAKAAAAYASACAYVTTGLELLGAAGWARRPGLAFALGLERAECEYLNGKFEAAKGLLTELLARAESKVDLAAVYRVKVDLHIVQAEYRQAVDSGRECLRRFGLGLPAHPTRADVQAEYERICQNLRARSIESLLELPLMGDPEMQAALRLLSVLVAPAFFCDGNLSYLVTCRMVNLTLEHGTTDASAHGYTALAGMLGPVFHCYREGYRFGKLACSLVEKYGVVAAKAKAYLFMEMAVLWTEPLSTAIDLIRLALRVSIETSDLTYACFCHIHLVTDLLLRGVPLNEVWAESQQGLDFGYKAKYRDAADIIVSQQRFIQCLRGRTATLSTFSDGQFDEAAFEAQLTPQRMPSLVCWYWVLKLQARFLAGDYEGASAAAQKAQALYWPLETTIQSLDYHYYGALTRAARHDATAGETGSPAEDLAALKDSLARLAEWAEHCPTTFGGKHALVAAELARLRGRDLEAMHGYEAALQAARAQGFAHDEGLASELAARFYFRRGLDIVAQAYLRQARAAYLRWGALGKVRQLEAGYPQLREQAPVVPGPTSTIGTPVEQLDLATVMKAAQAVAGELELDKLIHTLLRIALEHAGADRGLLLLPQDPELQVAAEARSGPAGLEVQLGPRAVTAAELPGSLLRYVRRSQTRVILEDAAAAGQHLFSSDAYFQQQRPRSVLALPLVGQGRLRGALYLENRAVPGVFTPERLALLELVAGQAAIALEHARLYADLARLNADLTQENRGRQEVEVRLRDSEERFRLLSESALTGVYLIQGGRFRYVNPALARMFGYAGKEVVDRLGPLELAYPEDRPRLAEHLRRCLEGELEEMRYEFRGLREDGSVFFVEVHGRRIEYGGQPGVIGTLVDVTEPKRAEAERQAHVRFLEGLDRVSQAMQGTNDLEQMMRAVLEAVRSIFGCDRAWLLYPCEPQAPDWRAVMEQTVPEFPGAFALGRELPVDPEVAEVFRTARASPGAVRFGPGSDRPVPSKVAERFSIQSILALAVYPLRERPYLFGLHQCAFARDWTVEEMRLFEEIGRRLADVVTSLLMFRSLRDSETKLEEAQRLAHLGYWERDFDSGRVALSGETLRIFGLQPQQGVSDLPQWHERWLELMHPEDRPRAAEAVAAALQGGPHYDIEYRVIRPNGEVRTVHSRGDVMREESGQPRRIFGMLQDITERKRAEQRLLAQHRVTQILAEAASLDEATPQFLQALGESLAWDLGALWRTDRPAGVLRCAAVWRRAAVEVPQFEAASRALTFRPGARLPGQVWLSREPAYVADLAREANFPRLSLAAAEGLRAACAFPILLGGEVLGVLEFFSREPQPPDAELVKMMAALGSQLGQFIERKRAEEALQQAHAELAHVMRLTTVSELAASIAHEINQPLGAIVNNAHACLQLVGALPGPGNPLEEALSDIISDANRASAIIARVRALVKKTPFEKAPLELGELLAEVLALAQRELSERRIRVVTRLALRLPRVWGDRVQLQQVFLNLVINAIEAMGAAAEDRRVLTLEAQRDQLDGNPAALVRVQDLGAGFGPGQAERLFEAFYTTKAHGLGMGLRISRSIMEAHGGRLWARANADWGATFLCALPARGHGEP